MEMLAEAMEETPSDSRMHLQMMVFSQSVDLAIDKEGRCSIPRSMLDDVAIESELVFSGNGNTFSICSPAEFERRKAEAREAVVVKKTAVMPALPRGIL
jgi:DNA-binding transcriptional regulator/RsmH inhibitor MraZ